MIGFGIVFLLDALTYRARWIKKRLHAGGSKTCQFDFLDDRILMESDSSKGHFLLSGFIEMTHGRDGAFLIPQKGLSLYIPWHSVEPQEALPKVQALLTKSEAEQASAGNP